MITLHEGAKDPIHICDITRGRKVVDKLFWIAKIEEKYANQVENVRELFRPYGDAIKKRLRVNQEKMGVAMDLLDEDLEPSDEPPGVHKAYWYLRHRRDQMVKNEMDLRGSKMQFELNFPRKKDDWGLGTAVIMGSSGSGKGYWLVSLLMRHLKGSSIHHRRKIYYCSPELYIDTTLAPLRDSLKWSEWFVGIDCGIKTGEESGLDPEQFYKERIHDVLVNAEHAIVCLDDIQDSYCPVQLRRLNTDFCALVGTMVIAFSAFSIR